MGNHTVIVVAGSALNALGLAMLMLGDGLRRLRWALARRAAAAHDVSA